MPELPYAELHRQIYAFVEREAKEHPIPYTTPDEFIRRVARDGFLQHLMPLQMRSDANSAA